MQKRQYGMTLLLVVALILAGWLILETNPAFSKVQFKVNVLLDRPVSAFSVYAGNRKLGTALSSDEVTSAWNKAVVHMNEGPVTYMVGDIYEVRKTEEYPSRLIEEKELELQFESYLEEVLQQYSNRVISVRIGSHVLFMENLERVYDLFTLLGRQVVGETEVLCVNFENGQPVYRIGDNLTAYRYDGILPVEGDSSKELVNVYVDEQIEIQVLFVNEVTLLSAEEAAALLSDVPVYTVYREVYTAQEKPEPIVTYNNREGKDYSRTLSVGTPSVLLRDELVYYQKNGKVARRDTQSEQVLSVGVPDRIEKGSRVFHWPVDEGEYTITSYYGYRPEFGSFHYGLDLSGRTGTFVHAAADGIVTRASDYTNLGLVVIINHQNGFVTWYCHNSELLVEAGDYVYAGQIISLMGSTGFSTGSHCHFELCIGYTNVDPLAYLEKR